jgi:hypothetical protein
LAEDRRIDPQRVITDIGLDELSLKKRHRLYPMFGVKPPRPAAPVRENALFSRFFAQGAPRRPEKCSDNLIQGFP